MENLIDFSLLKEYDSTLKEVLQVWTKQKAYSLGDKVKYKGHLLECTTAGTSGTTTLNFTGLGIGDTINDGTVVWELVEEESGKGIDFYTVGESYEVGDIVIYSGNIYQCITAHTATSTFDNTKWEEVSKSGIPYYNQDISYEVDDQVVYNNKIYKCITAHTSTSTFDATKWTEISAGGGSGIAYWASSTSYSTNDLVIYNDKIYRCTTAHTSTSSFDTSKWTEVSASTGSTESDTGSGLNYLIGLRADSTGIHDLSNNTWTNNNVTYTGNGRFGNRALTFNGTDSLLTNSSPIGIVDVNEDFTLCYWMKHIPNSFYVFGIIGNILYSESCEYGNFNYGYSNDGIVTTFAYKGNNSFNLAVNLNNTSYFDNKWHYIAVTRKSNVMRFFIDGTLYETRTISDYDGVNGMVGKVGQSIYIGMHGRNNPYNYFNGYIDDLCFIKGTALWDSDFVPPNDYIENIMTKPKKQPANLLNYLMRIRADGSGVHDLCNNTKTVSNVSTSYDGRFDGKSLYFDGSTSEMTLTPFSKINQNEDFTMSLWYKIDSSVFVDAGTGTGIIGTFNNSVDVLFGYRAQNVRPNNTLEVWLGGSIVISVTTDTLPLINAWSSIVWHHLALTRESGIVRLFIDGIKYGQVTNVSEMFNSEILPIRFMCYPNNEYTNKIQGHIDDVCIIKGEALWTNNFNPPTDYLPDIVEEDSPLTKVVPKVHLKFEQNLNDEGYLNVNWTPVSSSPVYEAGKSGYGLNLYNFIKSDVPWFNIIPRVDDFTIDFWFELKSGFSSSGVQYPIVAASDTVVISDFLLTFRQGCVRVGVRNPDNTWLSYQTVEETPYIGNGYHHAIFTRQNTHAQYKIDGILIYDIYDYPSSIYVTDNYFLYVGTYYNITDKIVIDDFKIY